MAFSYRGRCYMAMQEYKRGLYDFSAAIRAEQKKENRDVKSDENLSEFYLYAGQCNHMLGQFEEAILHYNFAYEKNKDSAEVLFHRGQSHVAINAFHEGIKDFMQAE